jgi:hypothetical protein
MSRRNFGKRKVFKEKSIVKDSSRHVYEESVAKEGHSLTFKGNSSIKDQANLVLDKTHVAEFFNLENFTWIWQN